MGILDHTEKKKCGVALKIIKIKSGLKVKLDCADLPITSIYMNI